MVAQDLNGGVGPGRGREEKEEKIFRNTTQGTVFMNRSRKVRSAALVEKVSCCVVANFLRTTGARGPIEFDMTVVVE